MAYTANIVGSLLGIGLFMLCSALWLPPLVWFAIAFAAVIVIGNVSFPDAVLAGIVQ